MEGLPSVIVTAANEKSRRLRELVRAPEILVMPGAHDVLSALLFARMGFTAIQCSSAGIAAVLGYPDGELMGRDRFVEITGQIAAAVDAPVNADGEAGYGGARQIPETVRALVEAGAAGMNLEDGVKEGRGQRTLADLPQQLEKIAAVNDAKRTLKSEFFLNARVDALAIITDDPVKALDEAIRRGNAYAESGADCIFYLNAHTREVIGRLVREVRAPVSVLAGPQTVGVGDLQDLGVARVSYGSAFTRMAIGAVRRLAREVQQKGTLDSLVDALPSNEFRSLVEGA
jgi:2-methylisocitrate lyase-like PEP mutase family enzyme